MSAHIYNAWRHKSCYLPCPAMESVDFVHQEKGKLRILSYTDYRAFLRDFIASKKKSNPRWSFAVWSKQLGIKSSSTLVMILKGQRNPGRALVSDLAKYFRFNKNEERYFEDLVTLSKTRGDVENSLEIIKKLNSRNPDKGFTILGQDTFLALSQWQHFAIVEMIRSPEFLEDHDWISSKLLYSISSQKVREAISTLLRLKIVLRNGAGKLEVTSHHLDTATDVADVGLKMHHAQHLDNAKRALNEVHPKEREISGGCLLVNMDDLSKIKESIRNFQMQMCHDYEKVSGNSVYQLEVAFFPLSKDLRSTQ